MKISSTRFKESIVKETYMWWKQRMVYRNHDIMRFIGEAFRKGAMVRYFEWNKKRMLRLYSE